MFTRGVLMFTRGVLMFTCGGGTFTRGGETRGTATVLLGLKDCADASASAAMATAVAAKASSKRPTPGRPVLALCADSSRERITCSSSKALSFSPAWQPFQGTLALASACWLRGK